MTSTILKKKKDELIWDIFCHSSKINSYRSLNISTVPSSRCHPETTAIIEKLTTESFKNLASLDMLLEDFKVVRVLEKIFYT